MKHFIGYGLMMVAVAWMAVWGVGTARSLKESRKMHWKSMEATDVLQKELDEVRAALKKTEEGRDNLRSATLQFLEGSRVAQQKIADAEKRIAALTTERDAALARAKRFETYEENGEDQEAVKKECLRMQKEIQQWQSYGEWIKIENARLQYELSATAVDRNAQAARADALANTPPEIRYVPVAPEIPDYSLSPMRIQVEHINR